MTVLEEVAAVLERHGIPFALIGATALAVHGVARSTIDQDLLVTDAQALTRDLWAGLPQGIVADIRRGDADDPLAGVVRLRAGTERDVDVVVGRHRWQADAVSRAVGVTLGGRSFPVVTAVDLVLLKLYAGGSQDRWDIDQLLALGGSTLAAGVEERLPQLSASSRNLWKAITAL